MFALCESHPWDPARWRVPLPPAGGECSDEQAMSVKVQPCMRLRRGNGVSWDGECLGRLRRMVHLRCGSGGGLRVLASAAVLLLFVFASARGDDDCALLAQSGASPTEISKCLLEHTERRPSDPAALLALGGHFHRIGETQDARTAYKNVIKMAPQSDEAADAHLHMGVIHHSDGEFKEALEYYQARHPFPRCPLSSRLPSRLS